MADELKRGSIEEGRDGKKYLFLGGDRYDKANWKPLNPLEWAEAESQRRMEPASDVFKTLATGSLATPIGGMAGLAGALLPGPQWQGAHWSEATRNALTYQPRTEEAEQMLGDVTAPFRWWSEKAQAGGGRITDVTGSPLAGTAVSSALEFLPALVARGLKPGVASAKTRAQAGTPSIKMDTWKRAEAEGYIVPPSAIDGGFVSKRLESIGGKAAIGQEAAKRNQAVTDKIARREAGLGPEDPISEGALAKAREVMAEPYRQVAALSPMANAALKRLQDARFKSKTYWRSHNVSGDPKALAEASKWDTRVKTFEKVIESEANRLKRPELVSQLKEARTAIAKNHAVDRALNPGSGEVDAHAIGRMLDRGEKLSGGLETIGRFALAFRPYAREASGIPTPGVSKSEALAAGILGVGGTATGLGAWPAALPLLGTPARSLALSRMMRPGQPGLGLGMRGLDVATRRPLLYTMMPGLGMVGVPPEHYQPQLRQR